MKKSDLAGKKSGRLTVLGNIGTDKYGKAIWLCQCECGNQVALRSSSINSGTQSCGCIKKEMLIARSTKHGKSKTAEYKMWTWAKHRAVTFGLEFNLDIKDIVIPDCCPVFGIKLKSNTTQGALPESPSLDRINPQKGYIKGNVWVISYKANSIKNAHSLAELEAVVTAIKSRIGGTEYIEVSSKSSTMTCSTCGAKTGPQGRTGLSVRQWECSACGAHHDRDINAAINTFIAGAGTALEGLRLHSHPKSSICSTGRFMGDSAQTKNGRKPPCENAQQNLNIWNGSD